MNIDSVLQANHIDIIRKRKNMTVDVLCEGITDSRQFRRYKSGESDLPFSKLQQFCDRLSISLNDFFYSLMQKDRGTYSSLSQIYDLCAEGNHVLAKEKLSSFNYSEDLDFQNKRFYTFLRQNIDYNLHLQDTKLILNEIIDASGFKEFSQREVFDFVDILYLLMITNIQVDTNNFESLDLLEKIVTDDELMYVSSENKHILPNIYANLAIFYGRQGNLENSQEITKKGIDYSKKYNLSDALPSLYYSKMLINKEFNNIEMCHQAAIECISSCISKGDSKSLKLYRDLIINDIDIDPITLFTTIYN